jgi:hypothetical protein
MVLFPSVPSSVFTQDNIIEISCQFENPKNPIKKTLLGKKYLNLKILISNISDKAFFIPSPNILGISGNPSVSILTKAGEKLDCNLLNAEIIPIPTEFKEISYIKIPPGRSIRLNTNVFKGCEFYFKEGEKYTIIAEFRAISDVSIILDGQELNIWQGSITSQPINFIFDR